MGGFITIERDLFKHTFFAREPMSEREAWVWMIARAAWKETTHRVGSKMLPVERGTFFCTLRELQSAWGWRSDKKVRCFLKRTQAERMTVLNNDAKKTHITICNYDEYQSQGRTEDATGTQADTHDGRNGDALKEQVNKQQVITTDDNARKKSEFDAVILAAGIDPSKDISGKWFSTAQTGFVSQWRDDLNLSQQEILEVVRQVANSKRGPPPNTLNYFTPAMQERAGQKQKPKLKPIEGNYNGQSNQQRNPNPRSAGLGGETALEQIARLTGLDEAPRDGGI